MVIVERASGDVIGITFRQVTDWVRVCFRNLSTFDTAGVMLEGKGRV